MGNADYTETRELTPVEVVSSVIDTTVKAEKMSVSEEAVFYTALIEELTTKLRDNITRV